MKLSAHFLLGAILLLSWTALVADEAHAQSHRCEYILGIKEKGKRTTAGAKALSKRIHQRLLAARLPDHTLSVDGARSEVRLTVVSDLPPAVLADLILAPSRVELLHAHHDEPLLEGLQDLLPKGVTLGRGRVGQRSDIYLYGTDTKTLEKFADSVALSDFRVLVGALGAAGARSWLVRRDEKGGLKRADALDIAAGAHPNYHYLTAWWQDRPPAKPGDHLLLAVDGRVVSDLGVVPPSDEGRITIRMPQGSAKVQLQRARWLAGRLAAPHDVEVVVVSEEITPTK
jgi:hypothetical protein